DYIHKRGLLHRDIKPDHLLVRGERDEWRISFIDFGLASDAGSRETAICGTPGYIAPECFKGNYSPLSDLFSLGAAAFVTAGGDIFRSSAASPRREDFSSLRVVIDHETLAKNLPGLDKAWTGVLARLLNPDPFERFPTAGALVKHLLRLAGERSGGKAREGTHASHPVFVGRKDIVDGLASSIERILGRKKEGGRPAPAVTVLKGPRGIGKSAIIEEIRKRILLRFSSQNLEIPVIVEGTLSGFLRESGEGLGQTAGDASSSPDDDIRAGAQKLLSSGAGGSGLIFMLDNPGETDAAMLEQVAAMLSFSDASSRGLAFVVEWDSDAAGRGHMEQLSRAGGVALIEVGPLAEKETRELAGSCLGAAAGTSLLDMIAVKSGGHPFFAVELAFLAAGGKLEAGEKDIPQAAREIVEKGIRTLPLKSGKLMTAAMLAGGSIDVHVASAVLGARRNEILHLSSPLVEKGWIELEGESLKLHPLVADVAAEAAGGKEDKAIHLGIAKALAVRGEGAEDLETAFHFFMGGDESHAPRLIEAAGLLEERSEIERGLGLLERALSGSADKLGSRGKLLAGRLLRVAGKYDKALKVLALIGDHGADPAAEDEKQFEEASVLRLKGESSEAKEKLLRLLSPRRRKLELDLHARGAALLGRMLLDEGQSRQAVETLRAALDREPEERLKLYLLEPYALSQIASGNHEEALDILGRGLKICRNAGMERHEARYRALLGYVHQLAGRYDEAAAFYREAAQSARSIGNIHACSVYTMNLGSIFMDQGKFAPAAGKLGEAARALESIGGWRELAGVLINTANLELRIGDVEGARRSLDRCSRIVRHYNFSSSAALLGMIEGDLLSATGDFAAASKKYAQARKMFLEQGNKPYAVLSSISGAEASLFAGDKVRAAALLDEVKGSPELRSAQWLDDRWSLVAGFLESEKGGAARLEWGAGLVGAALENFRGRREKYLILRAHTVLMKLLLVGGRIRDAKKHFDEALRIAQAIRRESLVLGYDPSGTDAYMKMIRKVIKMKDLSFGPFSIEDSVAIENRGGKWARLARINKRINSELRPRPLLELILDTMIDITQAARGFIILREAEGGLGIKCARNIDSSRLQEEEDSFSRSIVRKVMESGRPVITVDAASDELLGASESVAQMNLKSVMAVPLAAKGKVTGAIYVDNPYASNIFSQEDVQLLMTFADQAAIALENARLLTENRKRERKIERLNRRLEKLFGEQKVELDAMRETIERSLPQESGEGRRYSEIIGRSKSIQKVFRLLDRIVETDLPAVIAGESGTGKELVARAIHFNSRRNMGPFVTENCGAIPETLLESVLFGHVKGAFTGANRSRPGLFEMASSGTLFLDEIDSMSMGMQTKLLRTLQDGMIRPLGGSAEKKVNVRVLAATGTKLDGLVQGGAFREDLFYRINVITIELPPLRERREDIPLLVSCFVEKHGGGRKIEISQAAMKKMMDYDWPGNVRQLENEIMRAIVLSEGRIMEDVVLQDVAAREAQQIFDPGGNLDMKESVERLETALIKTALSRTGGNQSAAARLLGVSRFGLIKKMTRFGLKQLLAVKKP
ncbi:MAG: sigma 54-interacting transcriptional regulator, partial [Pseudomonadota bacterium]